MLGLNRRTDCIVSDGKGPKPTLTKNGSLIFVNEYGPETADVEMGRLVHNGVQQDIENMLRITKDISRRKK